MSSCLQFAAPSSWPSLSCRSLSAALLLLPTVLQLLEPVLILRVSNTGKVSKPKDTLRISLRRQRLWQNCNIWCPWKKNMLAIIAMPSELPKWLWPAENQANLMVWRNLIVCLTFYQFSPGRFHYWQVRCWIQWNKCRSQSGRLQLLF